MHLPKLLKYSNTKYWQGCRATGSDIYSWWGHKMGTENHLAASYKIKHATAIPLSNCTPRYLAQRNEKLCSHKNLYINVHSSFFRSTQKL